MVESQKPASVLIVGMGQDTRPLIPWDDYDEVWILNEMGATDWKGRPGDPAGSGFDWVQRWDRLFQLHDRHDFTRKDNHNYPHHWEWLQNNPGNRPIYMHEAYDDVPGSVEFPLEQIIERAGEEMRHFTCTAAYLMAFAWYIGAQKVGLYGFSMSSNTEYAYQRDTVFKWEGFLRGQGVELDIPKESGLSRHRFKLYGYDGSAVIFPHEFEARRNAWWKEHDRVQQLANEKHRAARVLDSQLKGLSGKALEERAPELRRLLKERQEAVQMVIAAHNAAEENEFWRLKKEEGGTYRQLFELRERAIDEQAYQAQAELNVKMGQRPEAEKRLRSTPSTHTKARREAMIDLQKVQAEEEELIQKVVALMARKKENQYWQGQCDMHAAGFDVEAEEGVKARPQVVFFDMGAAPRERIEGDVSD